MQVARGFAMGSADLVPGVSGGTVALVFGIYHHLVATIHDAARVLARGARLDLHAAWKGLLRLDWAFLLPLLAGIALAIAALSAPLSAALEDHPVVMSAVFFGLVAGSTIVARHEVGRWDGARVVTFVAVAAATFVLLGLRGGGVDDPHIAVFFAGGALAVCAMVLPGVSGAFLLLMVGLYDDVLAAVSRLDLAVLGVFTLGAAIGLGLFASALAWLLDRHRDTVMAALIGLMAGSLRVLWMWPADGVGDTRLGAPVTGELPGVVAAVVGSALAVVALSRIGLRRDDPDG